MGSTIIKAFGEKAYNFAFRHPSEDKFITILEGAIRSGKTFSFHPKIIYGLLRYEVAGLKVFVGVSKQTVKDNLLNDLFNIVGADNYHHNAQSGELTLFDVKWLVIGAKDEGSEKFLRGKTIGIAIVEEAVLIPKSFFMQLMGRLSPKGARLYANTNPDTPGHYLKKEVIDNPEMVDNVETIHFDLDDNPSLPKETRDKYNRAFTGVFHQRFIQGLWVAAEGAIYGSSWDDAFNLYTDLQAPGQQHDTTLLHAGTVLRKAPLGLYGAGGFVERWISVDCGTDHPQVYIEWYDDGTTIYAAREYFWDSKKEQKQLTDGQYADDLVAFMRYEGRTDCEILVPPECASFKAELSSRGLWHQNADNEVRDGIRVVSSLMYQRKVLVNEQCKNIRKGVGAYIWDKKASERGEEQPVKKDDDAMDAFRYGLKSKVPEWRISA